MIFVYNDEDNAPMFDYPLDKLPFSELYQPEEEEENKHDTVSADTQAHR